MVSGTHITLYTTRDQALDHVENLDKEYVLAGLIKNRDARLAMLQSICKTREFLETHYTDDTHTQPVVVFCHGDELTYKETELETMAYYVGGGFYTAHLNTE